MSSCLVSIVIVNYNAGPLLSRCLASIEDQALRDFEIIIVDNASSDGSLADLSLGDEGAASCGRIRLIRNDQNRGFAAAQNQGLRLARGRYLMPLNFDVEMTPGFLAEMVAAIESGPDVGLVAGKLLQMSRDGERFDTFYSTGHLLTPGRCILHRGAGERDVGQYDEMVDLFGAPGAAPLYRREMLEDIQFRGYFFDESLFTWFEDVDLDWRATRLGWRCVYAPRAVAYHIGHPEEHGGDPWKISTQIRNRWLVIAANEVGPLLARKTRAMILYEMRLLRDMIFQGHVRAYLSALRGFIHLLPIALAKRRWTAQRAAGRR
jgi:GT2 family glycosyltransferase